MAEFENLSTDSLKDWYNGFSNHTQVEPVEQTKNNPIGNLLVFTMQAQANLNFISGILSSIEDDVRRDIVTDIMKTTEPRYANAPTAQTLEQQTPPLKYAVDNKDEIVKAVSNIVSLTNSIKSILDRVKIKES